MRRFVINIKEDTLRRNRAEAEMNAHYPGEYTFFEATKDREAHKGISMSFRKIIIDNYDQEMIHILEDDVRFMSDKSREIFESNMFILPADWDIYLGGSYTYNNPEDRGGLLKINNFRSLHCAVIRKSAYDLFLSHDWTATNYNNIDAWVAMKKPNVYLCNPQIAIQYNGYSHNMGLKVNNDHFLRDKNIIHG